MNNKAPIDREASGESDPPLLPQIDFLQVDGRSVDDYEQSGVEGGGDLQSTEQHQSLSRGSNGGVYQDDIYRESDERRQRQRRRLLSSIGREGRDR